MNPRFAVRVFASTLAVCACLLACGQARAATFEVSPVRVALSRSTPTATVTVHNASVEAVRLQLKAFSWSESEAGAMQLAPAADIIFFPAFLSLAPGESRAVRVGGGQLGPVEATYRLFLEELPPIKKDSRGGVHVLTRMGIPIFVQDVATRGKPRVDGMTRSGMHFEFAIHNDGDSHFSVQTATLTLLDSSGKSRATQSIQGWYILAHTKREYGVDLPPSFECAGAATLRVDVVTDEGPASATVDASCPP